jgi:hypothetical protein
MDMSFLKDSSIYVLTAARLVLIPLILQVNTLCVLHATTEKSQLQEVVMPAQDLMQGRAARVI